MIRKLELCNLIQLNVKPSSRGNKNILNQIFVCNRNFNIYLKSLKGYHLVQYAKILRLYQNQRCFYFPRLTQTNK